MSSDFAEIIQGRYSLAPPDSIAIIHTRSARTGASGRCFRLVWPSALTDRSLECGERRYCRERRAHLPIAHVNGLDLYYDDEGEGTPVLFIHGGFGGVESTLFPQQSVFKGVMPPDTFRTITFDRRNSGRSGYSTKPHKIEDLAADAAALLDHLRIDRAVIVGDSMGGMVAMKFALR